MEAVAGQERPEAHIGIHVHVCMCVHVLSS